MNFAPELIHEHGPLGLHLFDFRQEPVNLQQIHANSVIPGGLFPNGMWVCGYLCLIVNETTRNYEHGSIFTSLYIIVITELLKYLQRGR